MKSPASSLGIPRIFLLSLAFGCASIYFDNSPANAQRDFTRDNIVFIFADDLGFADLGRERMPKLNALKRRFGTEFDRLLVHQSGTPSRTAFLTGKDPARLNMFSNFRVPLFRGIPAAEELISERLSTLGYSTCMVGKWGVGYEFRESPHENGFDDALELTRINNAGFRTSRFPDVYFTDGASEFIRSAAEPFFLYAAFQAAHSPYQAPREYFENNRVEFNVTASEEQSYLVETNGIVSKRPVAIPADVRLRIDRCLYYSMIGVLDDQVFRLYKKLLREGRADHTLFMFCSDNGGSRDIANNGNFRGDKATVYDGGHRSCNALIWPGVVPVGKEINSNVWIGDMFPTFAEVAGESNPGKELDGGSAISAILRNSEVLRGPSNDSYAVVAHVGKFRRRHNPSGFTGEFCVWRLAGKYIRITEYTSRGEVLDVHEELYIVSNDTGESREIIATGNFKRLLERLRNEYTKWGGDERLLSLATDNEVAKFPDFVRPARWDALRRNAIRSNIWP